MKAVVTLSMLALVTAGTAFADCAAPAAGIKVPDGATATLQEMVAAQHAVKDYDAQVALYTQCVQGEQDAAIAAGGDKMTNDQKSKVAAKFVARQDAEIAKLKDIAAAFNAQLKIFKAKTPPSS